MTQQEIHTQTLDLLRKAPSAILSTLDEAGFPEARAMLNLPMNTFKEIWFTTNTSSRKIEQIKRNNRGSVYFCISQEWRGVLLKGSIAIVDDTESKSRIWQPEWEMYYPRGVEDPDYAVLVLRPDSGYLYNQLQKTEFRI